MSESSAASEPVAQAGAGNPSAAEAWLRRLGDGPEHDASDEAILDAVERLCAAGREARAIDLLRRLLVVSPERMRLHHRVGELLASRGEVDAARDAIAPLVDADGAPVELWLLAAELAERSGEAARALALYERILAVDFDHGHARTRAARLRERAGGRSRVAEGTLMAEGVLARGRYRVLSELGRGGAGTVFLVEDVSLGRRCALKVYHRRGRGERVRLMSEARSAARFEHLGVVRVFDVDETLGAIAMELLPGSIRAEHRRGGLAAARVASWLRSVAEVLEHIHAAGVVHRDLKPSNLLLRGDDRVVLTDFGLACEVGAVPSAAEAGEGTLAYMPLEQRAGAAASPSMDLHALGVAARELLAAVAGPLPAQLLALAADCERARPEDRPTAAEVRAALDSFPRPAR